MKKNQNKIHHILKHVKTPLIAITLVASICMTLSGCGKQLLSDRQYRVSDKPVTVDEAITLKVLDDISFTQTEYKVSNELVSQYIENNFSEVLSTDRSIKSKTGDRVNIDFVGIYNDIEFTGGTAKNYELVIGEGKLLADFENQLVDISPQETKEITIVFPEDYKTLPGKEVIFRVTMNGIYKKAEYTDEQIKEVRNFIETELAKKSVYNLKADIWSYILSAVKLKTLSQSSLDESRAIYEEFTISAAGSKEQYLEIARITEEEYEKELDELSVSYTVTKLIIQLLENRYGARMTETDYQNSMKEFSDMIGLSEQELLARYGEDIIKTNVEKYFILDYVIDRARIKTKTEDATLSLLQTSD